jgi:hypothetical protein
VAAVVEGDAAALGDADLGEVQADAVLLADAVVFPFDDVVDAHAAERAWLRTDRAHRRRIEPADPTGAQPEPRQRVRDVVLPAPDPHLEHRRELDASVLRRREPQHAFAEGNQSNRQSFASRFSWCVILRMRG